MLFAFIDLNRDEIIRRCRAKVARRSVPPPTRAEIDHGVPMFLQQLIDALRLGQLSSREIGATAGLHGHDLLLQGFSVSQVVHDYGDVCQSITELAVETNAPISVDDFHTLNACLDDAIARAVTAYGRQVKQTAADGEVARDQRLGFFVHELGNLINTAMIAFEVLKSGNVGVGGSTGAVLNRSLTAVRTLIGHSMAEVRLTQGVQSAESLSVAGFVDELAAGASLAARAAGIELKVLPVESGLEVRADRQVLMAVVTNLLQNALKFTRPHSIVTLRAGASAERVLIEVEDECGGLPDGDVNDLFRPYEQRSANRSGLGLGLAFSRWGAEANHGRLYARNLPGAGCVFTVDLPRVAVPAVASVP
jgi:signal transduction histidine kinase